MKRHKLNGAMRIALIALGVSILGSGNTWAQGSSAKQSASTPSKPKLGYTISKETTYFTGPLKKDGTIDFVAAVNEHFANGVTTENNAARIIIPLLAPASANRQHHEQTLAALGIDPAQGSEGIRLQEFASFARDKKIPDPVANEQYMAALNGPWTEDECPEIDRWLSENANPLDKISEATRSERFYVPFVVGDDVGSLIQIPLEYIQPIRGLARVFAIRANLHMASQRWDKAWDDILTIKRLGELSGQGQTLVQQLVGVAIVGIACDAANRLIVNADLDATEWNELLTSWTTGKLANPAEALGVSERAMFIQIACQLDAQVAIPIPLIDSGQGEVAAATNKLVVSTLQKMLRSSEAKLDDTLRYSNTLYDRMAKLSNMEDIQARNEAMDRFMKEQATELSVDPDKSLVAQVLFAKPQDPSRQVAKVLLSQLLPAVEAVHRGLWRTQASQQVVKLALAARVVQARTGHLPASLRELEPLVEESAFVQPASGEPIQSIANDREFLIYHWASNRIDDGGDVTGDSAKDWGIRIKE